MMRAEMNSRLTEVRVILHIHMQGRRVGNNNGRQMKVCRLYMCLHDLNERREIE
jgi:hypothetical protein